MKNLDKKEKSKRGDKEKKIDKSYSDSYLKSYKKFSLILGIFSILSFIFALISFSISYFIGTLFLRLFGVIILMFLIVFLSKIKEPLNHVGKFLVCYGLINCIYFLLSLIFSIFSPYSFLPFMINAILDNLGYKIDLFPIWIITLSIGIYFIIITRKNFYKL